MKGIQIPRIKWNKRARISCREDPIVEYGRKSSMNLSTTLSISLESCTF